MRNNGFNKNKVPTINYVSELTGSGKTEYIINKIADEVTYGDEYFLIVTPNRTLCDEIYSRFFILDNFNDECVMNIHQKSVENPSSELKTRLRNKTRNVLITTHASFILGVRSTQMLDDWNLIMDEEMSLYKEHEINVTKPTVDILNSTITYKEYDSNFYRIEASNVLLWMNIANETIKDSFLHNNDYTDMVKHVMNDKFVTLVSQHNYEKFVEYNDEMDDNGKRFSKFYAMSFINIDFFNQFKTVTVISSFFEKTISYKLLQEFGCNMKKVSVPTYFSKHPNSDKITLHYFFEKNWSTHLRKSKVNRQKTMEELIYDKLISLIGDKPFLYNANVSFRSMFSKGTLAISTHGINRYKGYSELVFMPSLNATSSIVSILSNFGLNRHDIDFSRNVLSAYQFVSRGAIRDLNNSKDVNIYVMDRRTVDFLKTVFPDAKVEYHETEIGQQDQSKIPNNVKSFISRVKKRLNNGDTIRDKTLTKYNHYLEKYY
ncbi:hypothetical protein PBI_SCTP2_84 [Salicola phage SCTP-2]|nr:hypothetical protein PBI_SCTP2_84 [Salicola phage SCTP-2]